MALPRIVTKAELGKRALVRVKGRLYEGEIEELAPSGEFFLHNGQWLDNKPGQVLELLPPRKVDGKPTRANPLKKKGGK
ncbi:hypothetical protein [Cerasicoccus frondis]|uniref:hypothetical protein n=1 Tax=Cerasicoccus frondis TaxID=490090 RepID=UPI002852C5CD|nr:hypothetical protein [Cerasicoccus frondis]